jgi:hypothetical protein
VAQGDEANVPKLARPSEADLRGHLTGEAAPAKKITAPVIKPAAGQKYDDFQLAYALDLLRGKMTVGRGVHRAGQIGGRTWCECRFRPRRHAGRPLTRTRAAVNERVTMPALN